MPRFLWAAAIAGSVFLISWLFSSWQGRVLRPRSSVYTVVVANASPVIYSLNLEDKTLFSFEVPSQANLETAMGYGERFVGSLWEFGFQEGRQGTLLSKTLQRNFGIPIDAYIGPGGEGIFEGSFGKVFGIKTNLTFFDRLNIAFAVLKIGEIRKKSIDLVSSSVLLKKTLVDGESAYVLDKAQADAVFSLLRDNKIFLQGMSLTVINASGASGLGRDVARVAGSVGLRVVAVDTAERPSDGLCEIVGEKGSLSSAPAGRLGEVFGCAFREGETSGPSNLDIVLGKAFASSF